MERNGRFVVRRSLFSIFFYSFEDTQLILIINFVIKRSFPESKMEFPFLRSSTNVFNSVSYSSPSIEKGEFTNLECKIIRA